MIAQNERCSRCGTAPWEWLEDPFAYQVRWEKCHGCMLLDHASKDEVKAREAGVHLTLRRRT